MKTVFPLTNNLSSNYIDGSYNSSGPFTDRYNNCVRMVHDATLNQPASTTKPLKIWFEKNSDNPYPTRDQKLMLSMLCNMTLIQVSTWFANARRRRNKEYREYRTDNDYKQAFEQQNENMFSVEKCRENMRNRPSDDSYASPGMDVRRLVTILKLENRVPTKRRQENEIWSIENIISGH